MSLAWSIDPSIAVGVIFLAILGTASGWVYLGYKMYNEHTAIDTQIPFAAKIRKAVTANKGRKPKAICVLMETGSYVGDIYVTEKSANNKALFDFGEEGIGEHLVPEQHVKPIIIDGLKIFFGTYTDGEMMSMDEIADANKLFMIHDRIPQLRGIPMHMLKSLLKEPASDWLINCENTLETLRLEEINQNCEFVGIPETADEFVELLIQAKDIYENENVPNDVVLTSYESTKRIQKASDQAKSLFDTMFPFLAKKQPVEKVSAQKEYYYNKIHRNVRGIKFISPSDASLCRDSSLTVSRLQEYGMQREQMGREAAKNVPMDFMEKYGKIIWGLGIFMVMAAVAVVIVLSVLNSGKV